MGERDVSEAGGRARAAIDELAASPDPAAFQELLALSGHLGTALGASARTLAEHGSWSQVAGYAGTSKQAAWARWH